MSTCEPLRGQLSPYHDGEAGADEQSIRVHLERCEACRHALDAYRRLTAQLRSAAACEAPTLVAGVRSRLHAYRAELEAKAPFVRLAMAAVLLAMPLWALVLMGRERPVVLPGTYGPLSATEQRVLYGELPTADAWLAIVLQRGSRR